MGRFADKVKQMKQNSYFQPLELNERNVKAVFNTCTPSHECKDLCTSLFISQYGGFKESDETSFHFDRQALLSNRKKIEYLYGQLMSIHSQTKKVKIGEFPLSYLGQVWSADTDVLMQLLYLGSSDVYCIIDIFEAKDMTTSFIKSIKPTLSPNDPNFPAWWNAHKAEWETTVE